MAGRINSKLLIGLPTTRAGRRSLQWMFSFFGLEKPLGFSSMIHVVEDKPIADARNEICQVALTKGCDYIFMISDDVIAPPYAIMSLLGKLGTNVGTAEGEPDIVSMVTGVYWTKSARPTPYIWRGMLEGPYLNWRAGEFFQVDFAGCDCLLIDVRVLKGMQYPYFRTDWVWEEGQRPRTNHTEDYYFYLKAREAGFKLWCDSSVQCFHEDRSSGFLYGLQVDMPQAQSEAVKPAENAEEILVAELGAGVSQPWHADNARVIRFDAREDTKPDVRCNLYDLSPEWHERFDIVSARHVAEHFPREDTAKLFNEWAKLCKPGGLLVIRVPNVQQAMKDLLAGDPTLDENLRAALGPQPSMEVVKRAWDEVYGGQFYELDFHKQGFTPRKLEASLRAVIGGSDIAIALEDEGRNIRGVVTVTRPKPEVLLDMVDAVAAREGRLMSGVLPPGQSVTVEAGDKVETIAGDLPPVVVVGPEGSEG